MPTSKIRLGEYLSLHTYLSLILTTPPYLIRRILTPSNIFEDSLSAMRNGDSSLLSSYMNLGSLANAHDNRGNTLLHYAVALGQLQSVKILCAKSVPITACDLIMWPLPYHVTLSCDLPVFL